MENQNTSSKAVEKLTQWRDELKLKAHLFNAEAKERWSEVEKDWKLLETEMKGIAPVAKKAGAQLSESAAPLMRKIETSLTSIRDGIERHHKAK